MARCRSARAARWPRCRERPVGYARPQRRASSGPARTAATGRERNVTPSRSSVLAALAVVAGVLSWLVVHHEYESLPALPVIGPVTLGLLAAFELAYGYSVRSRLRNPGTRPIEPIFVAKLAVFAKASSHAGAIVAGLYGGFLAYTLNHLGEPRIDADSRASGLSVAASLALVAAALFLEYNCRVPRSPDERDD